MSRPPKYPWRTMAIGESFFAPGRDSQSIQSDARKYHRPRRYKCRLVMRRGVVGSRVTRVA